MEWSWLKDWWRLKKLRRNNQLRHNNNFNNGDDVDDDALNSGYEDEDFDDMCYCDECMNVRVRLLFFYCYYHSRSSSSSLCYNFRYCCVFYVT